MSSLNWSLDVFIDCYNSIKFDNVVTSDVQRLSTDLKSILVTPGKSDGSRNKIVDESKVVALGDGLEIKLNKPFIEAAVVLSSEFNLDEVATVELLYHSNKLNRGTTFEDSARLAYYTRLEYIVNILGYLISIKKLDLLVDDFDLLLQNLIKSFEHIYSLLNIINDLIDKQKVTNDINNLSFISAINFSKSQLFNLHEMLGQVLFSLMDSYSEKYVKLNTYTNVMDFVNKNFTQDDVLVIHFLPGILKLFTNLFQSNDTLVNEFYKHVTSIIVKDKESLSAFTTVTDLFFFTYFISWCKDLDSRIAKYDFREDILKYIEMLINYDVMDILLSYTAETASPKTELIEWSNLYDFRALLQKTHPRLTPTKFIYPSSQKLLYDLQPGSENVLKLMDVSQYKLSPEFNDSLLAPFFHSFFSGFITNAAIILTLLRDSEEDFLLSAINRKQVDDVDEFSATRRKSIDEDDKSQSKTKLDTEDGVNLDEISTRSELERFYLSFSYTYNNRPELCSLFWSDDTSNDLIGFISWGLSNNTSPLITSTFCLLLASLTSGKDASARIWEILVSNNNSTLKKNDYSKVSVDSIIDSLNYYVDSLNDNFELDLNEKLKSQQKRLDFLFSASTKQDKTYEKIIIELSEDSIVFISGFIQLVSAIVRNLTDDERCKEIKNIAFNRFFPIIKGFLKFDNLITGGKILSVDSAGKLIDLPTVFVNDENRVVLTNLLLNFMGDFVENNDDLNTRYKIWRILDCWIYQGLHDNEEIDSNDSLLLMRKSKSKYSNKKSLRIDQGFHLNLVHLSQVSNFIRLISQLLKPLSTSNQAFTSYKLLFPADLGYGYRINNQIGIWPYIEYILVEVFSKSDSMTNEADKANLQLLILDIIENSLNEVDWKFINDIAPNVIHKLTNFDLIFDSLLPIPIDYLLFVKLHHSIAILNYLFDDRVCKALFNIVGLGDPTSNLVELALKSIENTLNIEDTFIKRLLPITKSKETKPMGFGTSMSIALNTPKSIFDNIYYPKSIGTNGVTFYDIFSFHLSSVVHFALYVNSTNKSIATTSISILSKISSSSKFVSKIDFNSNDPILSKNRLLTIFESIDESNKIKYAFIEQFERIEQDLDIKYDILNFLLNNLNQSNGVNVSHFLLGYEIRGGNLHLNEDSTLLKCLLTSLTTCLDLITEIDYNQNVHVIDLGPAKLSSLILEIIVKLCLDKISSSITLTHLRDYDNLFEKLINYQPKIDIYTLWAGTPFNEDLKDGVTNNFIENDSRETFFSFINHRNLILQYLSLEFHNISSVSKKEYYIKMLLNSKEFLKGSPKILNFLDILNFSFKNFEIIKYEKHNQDYNLSLLLEQVQGKTMDMSILNKMYKIICQSSQTKDKVAFSEEVIIEGNKISEFLSKFTVSTNLRDIQLKCLHSWCQLIEILITDNTLDSKYFILEVLEFILPKINDYLESDISFSEELISLSVLLFEKYDQEIEHERKSSKDLDFSLSIQKLIPLFKTCISGIINSNSTPNLRSDLYILANKFLMKVFSNEKLISEVSSIVKSFEGKFVDIICNEAIYSEGLSRITSILLLESLIHLASLTKTNFVLEMLVKNNSLLLLVRSIKRADETLQICFESNSGIGLDTLLYELTAFKSTLYFLIRVSQSKNGSLKLIQSELFSILKQSNILRIDPDLGMKLKISDLQDVKVSLLLDTPLVLNDLVTSQNIGSEINISYYEFLIPIFQLISSIVLTMGPEYKPSLIQTKSLMLTFNSLIVGIMKRDMLVEGNQIQRGIYEKDQEMWGGLKELVRLFSLLDSLVREDVSEAQTPTNPNINRLK